MWVQAAIGLLLAVACKAIPAATDARASDSDVAQTPLTLDRNHEQVFNTVAQDGILCKCTFYFRLKCATDTSGR